MPDTVRMNPDPDDNNLDNNTSTLRMDSTAPGIQATYRVKAETIRISAKKNKAASFSEKKRKLQVGREIILNNVRYTYADVISDEKSGEANIYLIKGPDKRDYILKRYKKSFMPKIDVLSKVIKLKHPNIISLIDYGIYNETFFEIMEFAEGGTLEQHLPVRNEDRICSIVKEVNQALLHCHAEGVIHRDIKPANLFCRNKDGSGIMAADFGISSILEDDEYRKKTSIAATFSYAAPEVFGWTKEDGWSSDGGGIVGPEADYFSLGLTLIHLWIGNPPFGSMSPFAIANQIVSGDINIPEEIPKRIKTIIRGLITRDLKTRWGFEEVERWLGGEDIPVTEEVEYRKKNIEAFDFIRIDGQIQRAHSIRELTDLMVKYPDQGTKLLYRGAIAEWIKTFDRLSSEEIRDITEIDFPRKDQRKYGFIKAVYILNPEAGFLDMNLSQMKPGNTMAETLDGIGRLLDAQINSGDNRDHILTEESRRAAAEYSEKPYISLFLEARGQGPILDTIKKYNSEYSSYKAIQKTILLLLDGWGINVGSRIFNSFEELRSTDETVHVMLVSQLHYMNSKFLCWLEEMGLKTDSNNIEKCETAELVNLIREMPWLKQNDDYLKNRLNKPDEKGWTDLMKLAAAGNLQDCRDLIESGCDIHYYAADGITAFSAAAHAGQLDVMELLSGHNVNLNPITGNDSTLLHELCIEGRPESAAFLLQHGIDVNLKRNSDGFTPLIIAEKMGEHTIAHMLLQAGADPNVQDKQGRTAVHYAAGDGDLSMLRLLMKHGGRVYYKSDYFSPLMFAAGNGHTDIIEELINHYGADPNFCPDGTYTALTDAVQNDEYEAVHCLLRLGASHSIGLKTYTEDRDDKDASMQPLAYAVWHGNIKIAEELLAVGAEPNISYNGFSLLLNRCGDDGDAEMIKLLIEHGADVNTLNTDSQSPLHYILYSKKLPKEELTDLLLSRGADPHQADGFKENPRHHTPFTYAASGNGSSELVAVFLKNGANPRISRTGDKWKSLPLIQAAIDNQVESLKLLLENKKGINDKDSGGSTALHQAAYNGSEESVRLLLEHCADTGVVNKHGNTAADMARNRGYDSIERMLNKVKPSAFRTPGGLGFFLKLAAAIASIYVFLWSGCNGFFPDPGITGRVSTIIGGGALFFNILFWYNYACGVSITRTWKKQNSFIGITVKNTIAGAVMGVFLRTLGAAGILPPCFTDNLWMYIHPESAEGWTELLRKIPALSGFSTNQMLLLTAAVILAIMAAAAIAANRKKG